MNSRKYKGLSSIEAKNQLTIYGKNELKEAKRANILTRFFQQMNDFMIYTFKLCI